MTNFSYSFAVPDGYLRAKIQMFVISLSLLHFGSAGAKKRIAITNCKHCKPQTMFLIHDYIWTRKYSA